MDIEFAKTLHFRELDRRTELDQAATYRIAIIGVVGGIFSYYGEHIKFDGAVSRCVFMLAAAGAILFSALAIAWLIRSLVGYTWKYPADPNQMLSHYKDLERYVREYRLTESASDLFNSSIRDRLVQAASVNMSNNNVRAALIYHASVFLVWAIVLTLLAGVPLVFSAVAVALQP